MNCLLKYPAGASFPLLQTGHGIDVNPFAWEALLVQVKVN
jgi:hypothetical protein